MMLREVSFQKIANRVVILLLLSWLLPGCSTAHEANRTPTAQSRTVTAQPSRTATAVPDTPTPSATTTPIDPPTPVYTPTIIVENPPVMGDREDNRASKPQSSIVSTHTAQLTRTPTPRPTFHEECIEIQPEIQLQEIAKEGTVVLGMQMGDYDLLDLETGAQYPLPFKTDKGVVYTSGMNVSPDRTMLGYFEDSSKYRREGEQIHVWVVNSKGDLQAYNVLSRNRFQQWRWLNNQQLQIQESESTVNGSVRILNPFDGETHILTQSFPNFYEDFDISPSEWLVEYNPDSQRVVYLGLISRDKHGHVLWDMSTNKEIWHSETTRAMDNQPVWAHGTDTFAVIINSQLSVVTSSGDVTNLPDLGKESVVTRFRWSPDGKYIAFWVGYRFKFGTYLIVYHLQSGKVVNTCIMDENSTGSYPVWSPDSQQFIVNISQKKTDGSWDSFPILLDLKRDGF